MIEFIKRHWIVLTGVLTFLVLTLIILLVVTSGPQEGAFTYQFN